MVLNNNLAMWSDDREIQMAQTLQKTNRHTEQFPLHTKFPGRLDSTDGFMDKKYLISCFSPGLQSLNWCRISGIKMYLWKFYWTVTPMCKLTQQVIGSLQKPSKESFRTSKKRLLSICKPWTLNWSTAKVSSGGLHSNLWPHDWARDKREWIEKRDLTSSCL